MREMTIEELAKRRAWAQTHFGDKDLTDAELDCATYMPSENFSDGWDKGAEWALQKQWVSVEERLPEDDRLVLAHFADVEKPLDYATAYYRNGVWNIPDDWYYDCKVDFWMEIPQFNPEKE